MRSSITLLVSMVAALASASPQVQGKPGCTTTLHVPYSLNYDHTTTIYAKTTVTSSAVDCGSCKNLKTTGFLGVPPVDPITATVTSPLTTSTTYTCKKTPVPQ